MTLQAPTISAANDDTGTSFTASVSGPEGATLSVLFRRSDTTGWTAGGSVEGVTAGEIYTIQQTGLSYGIHQVIAVAELGDERSLPSNSAFVRVYDPDAETTPNRGPLRAMDRIRDTVADCPAWQDWTESASALHARRRIRLFGVDPPMSWQPSSAYEIGAMTAPWHDGADTTAPPGVLYEVTTAGTSGSTAPEWIVNAPDSGDTIADGTVEWTARAIPEGDHPSNAGIALSRPFMVIVRPENYSGEPGPVESDLAGTLIRLYIEDDVPESHQPTVETAGVWFLRRCSELMVEMLARANTPGHVAARRILLRDMRRAAQEERQARGDFAYAIMEMQF